MLLERVGRTDGTSAHCNEQKHKYTGDAGKCIYMCVLKKAKLHSPTGYF